MLALSGYPPFEKNDRDAVRAAWADYRGHRFFDLRQYSRNAAGDVVATKKGIALSPEHLPELLETAQRMVDFARENDLLGEEVELEPLDGE